EETYKNTVIKINPNGSKSPLFIVANKIYLFQQIVKFLDKDQPVYIILEDLKQASEMASHAIEQIRNIKPQGPYNLIGYSYEGLVVYEIAQQLKAQNEQVTFLGMLDTPTPDIENRVEKGTSLHKISQLIKRFFGLSCKEKISFLRERIEYRLDPSFKPLMITLEKFMNEYDVKAYPGKITLFSAVSECYGLEDTSFGWDKWVSEVEVHRIPGTHRSILLKPENAKYFAKQLEVCLTQ
ncbi:MAG: thioesterase domain-containing protein, partial [Cyanobacteria bacterium J06643_5]